MSTLAIATPSVVAAPVAADLRFDRTRAAEAQRELISAYKATRETANGFYHFATHSVSLDRHIAQQKGLDLSRHLRRAEEAFTHLTTLLGPEEAARVSGRLSTILDSFSKANSVMGRVMNEAGKPTPELAEVRLLTSQLYSAMALAEETQEGIGRTLGLTAAETPVTRAR
jgi:hypothetical protein